MKKLITLILLLSFTIKAQEIKIGTQTWTTKNLEVETYRNGEVIPQVQDANAWANLKTGAWCYYENNTANGTTYGKLYNWYAVNDPRGLAPQGYHIPSDAEWTILTDYLGGESVAGKKMKSTSGWSSYSSGGSYEKTCPNCANWSSEYRNKVPCHTCKDSRSVSAYVPKKTHSGNGTNTLGLAGLPGGYRGFNGNFYNVGAYGSWWSSSEYNTGNAWYRNLYNNNGNVYSFKLQ
jgi:uncharacterized protein (TIGR02145 family)